MSAGRRTPPRVVTFPQPSGAAYQRSQDVDAAFFQLHPDIQQYERSIIPGEGPEDMPAGTRVIVRRIGSTRVRAFRFPEGTEVCN